MSKGMRGFFAKLLRRKASQTAAVVVAPQGSGVVWPERRYDTFAKEAYLTNVIAYRCIREIAEAVASVPWKIKRRNRMGELEDVDNHPFQPVLARPNPYEGFPFFMQKLVAYLEMAGNVFTEKVRVSGGRIAELYAHRPDRWKIHVSPSTGLLEQYEYEVNGRKRFFPVDMITQRGDVLHLKHFHPLNDWWGAAPTESASREIDTRNEAVKWNFKLMQNQARPGLVYAFKGNLDDAAFERLEKSLRKFSGPENAGRNIIVDGAENVDVKPSGFTPQEMEFLEGNRELARNIAYGFGVPPQLIGIPGDNTYSNQRDARLAFWETTINFRLQHIGGELSGWLFENEPDLVLKPQLADVPALEPRHEARWERATKADFLTVNERRGIVGYEPLDEGDVVMVPATMLPLGSDLDGEDATEDGDGDGGEE